MAQNQNNFWVYGYQAGIDFNTTPPSFQGGFAIQAPEGAASVADPNTGALLFYTDGATVWTAANTVMPNGTGLFGSSSGQLSSTTAAVICEKPGSPNQYYLFTIDEQFSTGGLRYSVVDMNLNGGLGAVVAGQKNIAVFSTTAEKMCLVPNAQGTGFWLVTHDLPGNTFYAFSITALGVSTNPVVSSIGGEHANGAGHMKASAQFDRIAVANIFFQDAELFDFNNATGQLTNAIVLNYPFGGVAGGTYGIEFSCNGNLLYVSDGSSVVQFDLTAGNAAAILSTAYVVSSGSFSSYGLQRGPDQKIYISNGVLDVINEPNAYGLACDYASGAIADQSSGGGWGLPHTVYRVGDQPADCEPCQPITTNLSVAACGSYLAGDGTTYTSSGNYSIALQTAGGCDSIVELALSIQPLPTFDVAELVQGCGSQGQIAITATGDGPFTYSIVAPSQTNATGVFTLGPGTYTIAVTDGNGCTGTQTYTTSLVNTCPSDFNNDEMVGVSDLLLFTNAYGCVVDCCPYDLNTDGTVSVADLLIFISAFGAMCD